MGTAMDFHCPMTSKGEEGEEGRIRPTQPPTLLNFCFSQKEEKDDERWRMMRNSSKIPLLSSSSRNSRKYIWDIGNGSLSLWFYQLLLFRSSPDKRR